MKLDLTDEEAATLLNELDGIIDGDRYFLSPRIKTLRAIRAESGQSQFASRYHHCPRSMRHRGRLRGKGGERGAEHLRTPVLGRGSYSRKVTSSPSPQSASRMRSRVTVSQ